VRNIIKISVKIGMLQRGEKFSLEERESLVRIQKTLRTIAMTLVSFYQVEGVSFYQVEGSASTRWRGQLLPGIEGSASTR
jgi:hypothetical protein